MWQCRDRKKTEESIRKLMSDGEKEARLKEIMSQLNYNQLRYLSIRPNFSSDKDAAEEIELSEKTVYNWKEKELVKEALNLMASDGVIVASEILRRALPEAAAVKVAGIQSGDERIRQSSSTEVLDRGLGKPTQRTEVSGKGGQPIEITHIEIVKDYGE